MSDQNEGAFRDYRGSKVRRHDDEVFAAGGVPRGEESLSESSSVRGNLELLFSKIENIGASGTRTRSTAREYLSGHLCQVIDQLTALSVQKKDRVAAQWAVRALSVLGCRSIGFLIDIAEAEGIGKEWAGESLAWIDDALEKHREKLGKLNPAFSETKKRIQELERRRDVFADPGVIGQIVQKELAKAERYWGLLRFYRRLLGDGWEREIATGIPREYWASEPLVAFCEKSLSAWSAFLWPLIKKNNADFLVGVREGRFPTLGIRRHARWSRYGTEFRRHLLSLAKARD
jgi:hypothetical protein